MQNSLFTGIRSKLRLLFILPLLLAACQMSGAPLAPVSCTSPFEATVRQGPDLGLTLTGQLGMTIDSLGQLRGALTTEGGDAIAVSGQVNQQAINLVFTVGEEQYVFGTGTGTAPIYSCTGTMGGPFAGPQPGDLGDWVTCFFCPQPTPNPNQPPVIRNPMWNNGKIFIDAAASFIQNGASIQVSRPGMVPQRYSLQFDQSGTRLVAGGNQVSSPNGMLMPAAIPAGTAVTLMAINPNGVQSAPVTFLR